VTGQAKIRRWLPPARAAAAVVLALGVAAPAIGVEQSARMPLRRLITQPGWVCTQYSFATQSIGGRPEVVAGERLWLCTQWTFVGAAAGAVRPPAMIDGRKRP